MTIREEAEGFRGEMNVLNAGKPDIGRMSVPGDIRFAMLVAEKAILEQDVIGDLG